jgi:hypothetical protein
VSRRIAIFFAVTLAAVSLLSVVTPLLLKFPAANAQSADVPSGDLNVGAPVIRWYQGSSEADTVEFFGTSYFRGPMGRPFATELLAAMGIDRSGVSIHEPDDLFDDEDAQLVAYLDAHWLQKNAHWQGAFNVQEMARSAMTRGFSTFDVDVCALVGADVRYVRDVDTAYDECQSWTIQASDAAKSTDSITIAEHPDASFYRELLAYVVGGSLILSGLLVAAMMWWRNKSLKQLGGANLALCMVFVCLASAAVTITASVFLFGVRSVDDVLLMREWGWRQHTALVLGPGFISALPFLLSSIVIVRAKPRDVAAPKGTTIGGVPYWMVENVEPMPFSPSQQPVSPVPSNVEPPAAPPLTPPPSAAPGPWDPPT